MLRPLHHQTMKSSSSTVTVLEQCGVCPPPDTVAVKSLVLSIFDFLWFTYEPLGRVISFDFPYSTTYFTQNVVPNLKTSLSLALKHFTPLAGKLITPYHSDSSIDIQVRYSDGDSVSVTFAECTGDFDHFSGNHVRDADILKPLAPQLPPPTCINISGENCSIAPVLAIQVTVFPNRAICFGFTNSHKVADGSSIFNFVRSWASIAKRICVSDTKLDIDDLVSSGCFQIPNYDRSMIKDPYGLVSMFKKSLGSDGRVKIERKEEVVQNSSIVKVRSTFVINEAEIQALKNIVATKRPTLTHVSTFTVTCAYLWTCFAKMRATVFKSEQNLDEAQNFIFVMDCRARLSPPLPASYFGNCLVYCLAAEKGRVVIGDEGLVTTAVALGNAISAKLNGEEGVVGSMVKSMEEFAGVLRGEWSIGIAGSPKLDYYNNIDFGWGKPLKFEFVGETLSMSRCKDSKTSLEFGLILPKNEMDVFSTILAQGLQSLYP